MTQNNVLKLFIYYLFVLKAAIEISKKEKERWKTISVFMIVQPS